jgi:hypothetical protein
MRCPKCSYISFDVVESCAKCGKNISKAAEEIKGTIADVELPAFLNLNFKRYESEPAEEAAGDEMVMDMDVEEEEEAVDFALEEESAGAGEEVDFALEEEESVEAEPEMEISEEEPLDISDLGPSEEIAEEPVAEEYAFEAGEPVEAVADEEHEAKELEDLEVEGIDLESSSVPKSGRVMPSVKTGTALDDFDIDLGDLISPKKEGSKK